MMLPLAFGTLARAEPLLNAVFKIASAAHAFQLPPGLPILRIFLIGSRGTASEASCSATMKR